MNPAAARVLVGLAGYGLPGASSAFPDGVLDDDVWDAVFSEVYRQRLTGHLVHAIDDGALTVKDTQEAAALDVHERALALALVLEQLLLTTMRRLDRRGVAARVLRGPAVAHTVYPEPGLRSFADIDLLVAGADYDAMLALLCTNGARRRFREPRRGFERRFGKGVCLEVSGGLEIDVHRTLVAGPFGLAIDADALFENSARFRLGGQALEGLDAEDRLLDACVHATLDWKQPRLAALRDVAQMILCSPLAVARVRDRCRQWRCGIVVQRAIGMAWDAFGLASTPELVGWARSYEPTRFERDALQAYVGRDRSFAGQAVAGLQAIDGFWRKATYATSFLFPSREYIRTRDGSYIRRGARALRLLQDDASRRRQRPPDHAPVR
jgi:Uncharacterised nucleotidyltransferase